MTTNVTTKPKLAIWKFASCDGCQLTLLDCEDELLDIVGAVEIAYYPVATKRKVEGPFDLSLVEGSVTTPHAVEHIQKIREQSTTLVTIGACATAGGIQSLRNFADIDEFISIVYAEPSFIDTLETSTAISDHVEVDFELRGCPIAKHQLIEVIDAYLHGRRPSTPNDSVCVECKLRDAPCVMVSQGIPCMGPVTQAGCKALCPAFNRGCYGCFGPSADPNIEALRTIWHGLGVEDPDLVRALRTFNADSPSFKEASTRYEQ